MPEEILIVGGVAAGMSAASRARRLAPRAHITVLERGPMAAYGACGLPLWLAGGLAGAVTNLDALIAHPAEFFREQRQLDVRCGHEALEIEPGRRRVRVRAPGGEAWLPYDHLVLATGATARWRPAATYRNLYAANTWEQAQALDAALLNQAEPVRRVAVVGGGYIGLEVAEALARRGLDVTLVHAHAAPMPSFDEDLTSALPELMAAAGIHFCPGARVLDLEGPAGGRIRALLTTDGAIACEAVVNCGGLRPHTELARGAGVALGQTGAVAVDERQQTNLSGIFAAGDCTETRHQVTGAPAWIPLWTTANKQGRVAGQNAAGGPVARFPGVVGTLAVPLFGQEWGRTGLTLAQARGAGFDAEAVSVSAGDRAGYMKPQTIALKIVYDRGSGRLLGCHLRGAPGTVAGRVDAAAVALTARMGLDQIETLDFAYAPGLAPLYEPLAIAAHLARRNG